MMNWKGFGRNRSWPNVRYQGTKPNGQCRQAKVTTSYPQWTDSDDSCGSDWSQCSDVVLVDSLSSAVDCVTLCLTPWFPTWGTRPTGGQFDF
jgi:hypothetical protein